MSKEDLIPLNLRTPEERTEIARKGQEASVKARREKKLLSQIYAEVIAELYDIDNSSGLDSKQIVKAILNRGDAASVSMLKEMRESTEGNKMTINTEVPPITVQIVGVDVEEKTPLE